MKNIIRKMTGLFFIAIAIASCSKDDTKNKESKGECWYKITIDGQTTLPNRFGQDNIIFTSSSYPAEGDAGIGLSLVQTKANGQGYLAFEFSSDGIHFNRETPVGTTYTVDFFNAVELGLPDLGEFTYRMENNATPEDGVLIVTVLENSEQRIRFNISGTIMKKEGGVEHWTDVELVPLDAEFTFGRSNYTETTSGGVFIAGVECKCEE